MTKSKMIRIIERFLKSDEDLSFLGCLPEAELETLILCLHRTPLIHYYPNRRFDLSGKSLTRPNAPEGSALGGLQLD